MKTGLVLTLVLVVILGLLGVKYAGIRGSLVAEHASIEAAWADVNAALERRAGLVPDLAQTVQKAAPNETAVLQAVSDARARLDRARGLRQKIEGNTQLDTALGRLLLCAENYPKLEKSGKFEDLQDALKESEYRIAVARRKYNEAVEHYNTRLALFPNNVVAFVSRFGKIDAYIPAPPGAQTPSKLEY
jgi:LemA protein